jgi:hypothetical protein
MLALLADVERQLPALIEDAGGWSTMDVDYEPPRVERVFRTLADGANRVSLHRIHPCNEALYHPHPWPSAILVLSGRYEMGVGWGAGEAKPPEAARIILVGGARYEMVDEDGWHYVRPLGAPSLSVMVSGPPWKRVAPGKGIRHPPLADDVKRELLEVFAQFFATPSSTQR